MLTQICQYLRNWFAREKYIGTFKIEDGVAKYADGSALPLLPGQYYRIIGSLFNDGVHKLPEETEALVVATAPSVEGDDQDPEPEPEPPAPVDTLKDEPAFVGAVWSMAVPPVIVVLAADIEQWCRDNVSALTSPYSSESFGGYSYSIREAYSPKGGSSHVSWEDTFHSQLSPWRKI